MANNEYEYYDATIRVPKGTRISRSRKTDGAHAGNVHDSETKKLISADIFLKNEADSPTYSPPIYDYGPDEYASYPRAEDPPEWARLLAGLIVLGAVKAVEAGAPRLRQAWNERAIPVMKSAWKKVATTREVDRQAAAAESSISSREMTAEPEAPRVRMTSAEARECLAAALMARRISEDARLFSEEQIRMLRNADLEDLEIESVVEKPALGAHPTSTVELGSIWKDQRRLRYPRPEGDERTIRSQSVATRPGSHPPL